MTGSSLRTDLPFFTVTILVDGLKISSQSFQQPTVRIGRDPSSDISLSEYSYVSRKHLAIYLQNNSLRIVDQGSTAGTVYLGEKISSVEISSHGSFEIKNIEIVILFTPGQQSEAAEKSMDFEKIELTSTIELMSEFQNRTTSPVGSQKKSSEIHNHSDFKKQYLLNEERLFFCSKLSPYATQIALRTNLIWDDQVLSSSIVRNNEPIVVSGREGEGLCLPNSRSRAQTIGYVQNNTANIYVSNQTEILLSEADGPLEEMKFETEDGASSGLLTLSSTDRLLVKLNKRMGISYEFIDASERLNGAIFKEEDRRFLEIVRNIVLGTMIIATVLLLMSDSKKKEQTKLVSKKRIVEVVIPEPEVEKPKPQPKVEPPPKPKPKPAPQPQKKPKPVPKSEPKPKPKPKPIVRSKPKSMPAKVTKAPKKVRLESQSRVKPEGHSQSPRPQKPANTALAAFASFNKINTFKPGKVSNNFKIDPNAMKQAGESSGPNLIQSLNKGSKAVGGSSSSRSALSKVSADFSSKGLSDKTGKRSVEGAVVGTPKLQNDPNRQQGLSPDQVMTVVNRHLSEVQRCYERALFDQPNLSGRVEYEWTIGPSGTVQSVDVRRSEASGDKKLNDCVTGVFRKMKFPAATNGQSTYTSIGFPFGRL